MCLCVQPCVDYSESLRSTLNVGVEGHVTMRAWLSAVQNCLRARLEYHQVETVTSTVQTLTSCTCVASTQHATCRSGRIRFSLSHVESSTDVLFPGLQEPCIVGKFLPRYSTGLLQRLVVELSLARVLTWLACTCVVSSVLRGSDAWTLCAGMHRHMLCMQNVGPMYCVCRVFVALIVFRRYACTWFCANACATFCPVS